MSELISDRIATTIDNYNTAVTGDTEASTFLEDLFLDYFNNFLTVDRFAEYYGLDVKIANEVIYLGRVVNNTPA